MSDEFASRVSAWQRTHGRHDLPWQRAPDPYRIWLSEVMLQQTQVATVIPYYLRFLARLPSVAALAAAPEDEVLALWSGLGYYQRARNLHRCADVIVTRHGGVFPQDPAQLAALPGIGRSTAAAIAVFAWGTRAAILDGNVRRVLARVFGIGGDPARAEVQRRLWEVAERELPHEGLQAYTQGLMDLGATICTRHRPDCEHCPVATLCFARSSGRIDEFPGRRARREPAQRTAVLLVARSPSGVLLVKRPSTGVWGGLWSLPEAFLSSDVGAGAGVVQEPAGMREAADALRATLAIPLGPSRALPPFDHAFSHFRLRAWPMLADLAAATDIASDGVGPGDALPAAPGARRWWLLSQLDGAPLPAPVRQLLSALPA